MRATVSHLVRFQQTFIPDTHLIGAPGEYFKGGWQTCFTPHYAASFLGAAEAAYTYALEYLTTQNKGDDPYVQQHISACTLHIGLRVNTDPSRTVAACSCSARWSETRTCRSISCKSSAHCNTVAKLDVLSTFADHVNATRTDWRNTHRF